MANLSGLKVYVDLNGNGSFVDANEDLSSYVMDAQWQIGFRNPFDAIAGDNVATLVLRNNSKRFSPESGSAFSASWTVGKNIRIDTVDPTGSTTRSMYLGVIASIKPKPGVYGQRTCVVKCIGYFQRVQPYEAFVAVQVNKTADQVLAAIGGAAAVYPPGLPPRWLLGIPGWGELGQTTWLGAASDWLTADTGRTTFGYIGDKWGNGVSVYSALKDTAGREGGRLWVDRDGLLHFYNRAHLWTKTTVDQSFSGTMSDMDYSYGDGVINRATVRFHTRKPGAAPEVLSRIDKATKIPFGQSVTLDFRYSDLTASGAKIAGLYPITPAANTDYTVNSAADGSGTSYTANVSALILKDGGTSCSVKFAATGVPGDVYIQAGATLRGTALRDFGQQSATADEANNSITTYGLNPYAYPFEMDNYDDAVGMARLLVAMRGRARGMIKSVTIPARASAAMLTAALSRRIFDRITLTETQTGSSSDYFIIGEKHHAYSDWRYETTWILEPAGSAQYWLLGTAGYGELGQKTYLGPY